MKNIRYSVLILLFLSNLASVHAQSGDFGSISTVTALGYDPVTRFEGSMTKPGLSVCQEVYADIGKWIQAGAGFKYLPARDIGDGENISWEPLYGLIKVYIPNTELPVYFKASAGYTFVQGNDVFKEKKSDPKGGYYYFIGGGLDLPLYYNDFLRFSFVFDLGYSSCTARIKEGTKEQSLHYLTLDMIGGIGLKF